MKILTRRHWYLSLVSLSQSCGVSSESSIRNWDHWHLIWQNKKSSRGTFGLWGNILSGSLRILPKHFLPKPVSEPLDKKYQVWIWGSAFLLCYSLRDANKKIQILWKLITNISPGTTYWPLPWLVEQVNKTKVVYNYMYEIYLIDTSNHTNHIGAKEVVVFL